MSLEKIEKLLDKQEYPVIRKKINKRQETMEILTKLGVKSNSEFMELYSRYFLRALDRNDDTYPLTDPFLMETDMAHKHWGIPKNFILFSTGSTEGGYLYNTEDDSVWDFNLGEQQQLIDGTLPHWNSFYEFMEWYLDTSEDED
ncbi:Uncharacterised protein [Psychrobacter phenylpyruvicus]|uniref:SMI1 / KNR4 family n=2 Tax=Psychrobacter phenylpyruvicus TaxID=29432 RepID=A0A379LJ22_9GAMM|nr:Uncharacterised protein [Psychrobacter phenylpyruvicus]